MLNPFDLYGHTHRHHERDKAVQQLTSVLRSLTCKSDESLSTNMETLLAPCLTVLLARPDSTLFDLLRFVETGRNSDLLAHGLRSAHEAHRLFFLHAFDHGRFKSTRGAIATKIQSLLNSETFCSFMATPKSTVNLEHALNSGKTVLVSCAAGQLGAQTMTAIGRLVVGMVLSVALNRSSAPFRYPPIRLVIDEVQHFVTDELVTILTEARKYGLSITLACQIVGQGMSPDFSRLILGNTALKLLGDAGADSRRAMAREMDIPEPETSPLRLGQFVMRHGHRPASRIQLTSVHCEDQHTISSQQWRAMKENQIKRWYRMSQSRAPPAESSAETLLPATLADDIS